jgi:predicted O-methyltransferase YrrM
MQKIDQILTEMKSYAKENYVPIVRDKTLEKIIEILRENHYLKVFEIGTAIGYSTISMLANFDGEITSVEKDKIRYSSACENIEKAGFSSRATLIQGDAKDIIEKLCENGEKFDFIFLDGPKGQYIRYLPNLKILLKSGGTLFADNILLGGLIENEQKVTHKNRAMVSNMKAFLTQLKSDEDFVTEIFKIDDGFSISRLK